ncbi:hypothetical protein MKX03_030192 [Papaver bracteatum]|nr:hypothetical protein MKX03_030192 [Papaver bracteatum]
MAALGLFESDDDTEDFSKLKIDEAYKKKHEYNEKRKDLHRLQYESSESEAEEFDDDDEIKKLMDVLVKVKNQDPIIKQKDAKLFDSEDEESEEEEGDIKEKKSKPKYLKDVIAEKLLEDGGEDEDDDIRVRPGGKTYNQEQEERRKKFLDVAEREFEDDDDEDLLKVKKRGDEEDDGENEKIKKKCDDYFGNDEGFDENEKFLKNFIVKKMWVDKDKDKGKRPQIDDLEVLSEDDEEVWDQLDFERSLNFRYEEGTGDRILGHSRVIDGTVRKKVNRREEQRKRMEERMAEAEKRNREELKHLKNLKKKEIMEKLDKIQAIGGLTEGEACALDLDDFDPEEYDKKMKKTFNDDYYNAEDADFGSEEDDEDGDIEKPDFDKEDELLGLPKDWDVCGTGDGFVVVRERVLKSKAGTEDDEDEEHDDDEEDYEGEEHGDDDGDNEKGKRKRKRKLSLRERVDLLKEFDEYHKLDYEGTIGDLKRFGLSAKEFINMDDKELNQYVPLKKIAPYNEVEWKVPKKLRNQLKIKNKLLEQEALSKHGKRPKNHGFKGSRTVEPVAEEEKIVQVEKVSGDVGELSRKRKRKDRQKEVKPSKQRKAVYGVGDPKPKKKKN